jgi:two-component system, cell cycle response regulator
MNKIRVLLVEGDTVDARFLQEAFAEIEEATRGGAWMHCQVTHVDRVEDAALICAAEPQDIVLFNVRLPGASRMEAYQALRDAGPAVPLVALIEAGDEGLGRRMLREGAQDYLIGCEIDCDSLARTVMNAIERQRFVRAAMYRVESDFETGLPGREAFLSAAARDLLLAAECGRGISLVTAEIDNLEELNAACGRFAAHDAVLQAAIAVRNAAGEKGLAARIGPGRFAILDWHRTPDEISGALQHQIQSEHQEFAFVFGNVRIEPDWRSSIEDALRSAEEMLCENKLAYFDLP